MTALAEGMAKQQAALQVLMADLAGKDKTEQPALQLPASGQEQAPASGAASSGSEPEAKTEDRNPAVGQDAAAATEGAGKAAPALLCICLAQQELCAETMLQCSSCKDW